LWGGLWIRVECATLCRRVSTCGEFSKKEQRQYEHIKQAAEKSGRYRSRAKEVAARTVSKEHQEKGRAKGK
jgi:hypothetical protein